MDNSEGEQPGVSQSGLLSTGASKQPCGSEKGLYAVMRSAPLKHLLSVSGLKNTSPSFEPFKTLPQPLSHICFSRRKKIYNKKCFTLLHCIIVRNSVLFVNAWSAISVQFGDIFKWNIKDVNDKTKRVSIFIPNILVWQDGWSYTGLDHTFCAWLLNACNLKYIYIYIFFFPLK